MIAHLLASGAVLLALGGAAAAQEQPPSGQPDVPAEQQAPAGGVAPDPEPTGSTTGGVTAHGRENIPNEVTETPVDPETLGEAASGTALSDQADPGSARTVGPDMVEELRQIALEEQKKAKSPDTSETEEEKRAEQSAIAAHREALFTRIDERS